MWNWPADIWAQWAFLRQSCTDCGKQSEDYLTKILGVADKGQGCGMWH